MSKRRPGRPRKRRIYKRPPTRRIREKEDPNLFSTINPETKKAVFVLVLLVLSFLSFLALFNFSGSLGIWMLKVMKWVLGWLYFLLPFVLAVLGFLFLNPGKYVLKLRHYLGLVVLFLSSTALLNLIIGFENIFAKIKLGQGGGYLGIILFWPFFKLAGFWGTLVLLLGLFIISILLTFNLSIRDLNLPAKIRENISFQRRKIDEEDDDNASFDYASEEEDEEEGIIEEEEEDEEIKDDDGGAFVSADRIKSKEHRKKVYQDIQIPFSLLEENGSKPKSFDIEGGKEKIKRTLANFGINVEMQEVNVGPTVTQFTLKPDEGVRLSKIVSLQNNLSMSLSAHPLRIEAPIPGKPLVGIEVPNKIKSKVKLKEILSTEAFQYSQGHLKFALGKNVAGQVKIADLAKMPHLLIAGATGSGKSVCINALIISLLYKLNPNELKLILADPKKVELSPYNGIPHLLTPVITKADKTINALKWAVAEMDKRYDLISKLNKRDIYSYNKAVRKTENKMSSIVIIIDELAYLMTTNSAEVETAIIRLAQMSRAVGIHLVLATQRPSVNVITGLIKANITSRIAFAVASQIDSRTILDASGAEKLLGEGDMLFISSNLNKPRRLQGAFVSEAERERIIEYLKQQAEPDYLEEVTEEQNKGIPGFSGSVGEADSLLAEAKRVILKYEQASATFLQRRLSVGYARAAKILDQLEAAGVVGPHNGPKPREILIQEEDEEILESPLIDTEEAAKQEDLNQLEEAADEILEKNEVLEEEELRDEGEAKEDNNFTPHHFQNAKGAGFIQADEPKKENKTNFAPEGISDDEDEFEIEEE